MNIAATQMCHQQIKRTVFSNFFGVNHSPSWQLFVSASVNLLMHVAHPATCHDGTEVAVLAHCVQ